MDDILAPTQMYILLALVAIVASVLVAFLYLLFPRRLPAGNIVSDQSLAGDRWVISRRRQIVVGVVVLFAFVWTNVVVYMLSTIEVWTGSERWHFVSLVVFFAFQMIFIRILTVRLGRETYSLLPPQSAIGNQTSEARSNKDSNSQSTT